MLLLYTFSQMDWEQYYSQEKPFGKCVEWCC